MTKKKLYFFFPYRGVGGVAILFLRLAHYLSTLNKYSIYLIDYIDGYMAKNYDKDKDIKLVEYNDEEIYFEKSDIVIFQSMPLFVLPLNLRFNPDTKIIFWNLHPYNFFGYAARISKFKNKIFQYILYLLFRNFIYSNNKKTIDIFQKHKSLFFMDSENVKQTKNLLKINIKDPIYLPLILDSGENIRKSYTKSIENLNCIWIGRIADYKVHILLYTIKRLEKYCINNKLNSTFTIVGSGDCLKYLKEKLLHTSIKIIYINYINPSNIKNCLKDIDISFSMGTSALDTAKYGIPTVLLDYTFKEIIQDYKYDWLFNTKNYTLANKITNKFYEKNNQTLEIMIDELFNNYNNLSNKSFQYILKNFDIRKNTYKFISLIENATLTAKDIPNSFYKMNMFHKILGTKRYCHD